MARLSVSSVWRASRAKSFLHCLRDVPLDSLSKDDGDGDGDDGRHMFWTMSAVSSLCTAQASAQFGDKRHKQGGPSTYARTYIRLRT